MITNFNDYSGVIKVQLEGDEMYFRLKYDDLKLPFEVSLHLEDGKYGDLSIIIPDSDELNRKEFFLNPDINMKIVTELEKENFIQKSGKESIAGDKKTISYIIS